MKNYIEDQNASLVSYGIKINHKYKQVKILTEDDAPKLFDYRVFNYILSLFSRSQRNSVESVLIIQFKPINSMHSMECKEYAFHIPLKNNAIP